MKIYRYGWILLLLVAAFSVIACATLSEIAEKAQTAEDVANTVQALATTGQELATQVEGMATKVGESGAMGTAQALATQLNESGIMGTLDVILTQAPGQGADIKATLEAVMTQGAYGEAPPNIPIVGGDLTYFLGSPNLVTYHTPIDFQDVLHFYRTEMPNYGWGKGDATAVETSSNAKLPYQNDTQRATVTISINPANDETIVLINIVSK